MSRVYHSRDGQVNEAVKENDHFFFGLSVLPVG